MARSQNGYSANDRSKIASYKVPGGKLAIRKGDVATVLVYVATRFHNEVEPLKWPGNWGYAERKIRGGRSLSNHASGTAIDLNAPKHWLGARNTFTKKQVAAIRRILRDCGGVVRWGGDYRSRKDEMHFEINASPARVKKAAQAIRKRGKAPVKASSGSSSSTSWKTVKYGDLLKKGVKGEPVKDLQKAVGVKADGYFGAGTEKAVKAFQKKHKLKADGICGPSTWKRVKQVLASPKASKASAPKFPLPKGHWFGVQSRNRKNHSGYYSGDRAGVREIQKQLKLKQDGIFGLATRSAVIHHQRRKKLKADGLVGISTWKSLW